MSDVSIRDVCRVCGCTETTSCILSIEEATPASNFVEMQTSCSWADFDHTLCNNPRCIAQVPLETLESLALFRR